LYFYVVLKIFTSVKNVLIHIFAKPTTMVNVTSLQTVFHRSDIYASIAKLP